MLPQHLVQQLLNGHLVGPGQCLEEGGHQVSVRLPQHVFLSQPDGRFLVGPAEVVQVGKEARLEDVGRGRPEVLLVEEHLGQHVAQHPVLRNAVAVCYTDAVAYLFSSKLTNPDGGVRDVQLPEPGEVSGHLARPPHCEERDYLLRVVFCERDFSSCYPSLSGSSQFDDGLVDFVLHHLGISLARDSGQEDQAPCQVTIVNDHLLVVLTPPVNASKDPQPFDRLPCSLKPLESFFSLVPNELFAPDVVHGQQHLKEATEVGRKGAHLPLLLVKQSEFPQQAPEEALARQGPCDLGTLQRSRHRRQHKKHLLPQGRRERASGQEGCQRLEEVQQRRPRHIGGAAGLHDL